MTDILAKNVTRESLINATRCTVAMSAAQCGNFDTLKFLLFANINNITD
jgi:hypothetical protein